MDRRAIHEKSELEKYILEIVGPGKAVVETVLQWPREAQGRALGAKNLPWGEGRPQQGRQEKRVPEREERDQERSAAGKGQEGAA